MIRICRGNVVYETRIQVELIGARRRKDAVARDLGYLVYRVTQGATAAEGEQQRLVQRVAEIEQQIEKLEGEIKKLRAEGKDTSPPPPAGQAPPPEPPPPAEPARAPAGPTQTAMGTSLVGLWIVMFPLFVPHTRVAALATIAASAGPAIAVFAAVLGRPLGTTAATVYFFIPNYAAALIATVVDRSIGRAEREAATLGSYRLVEKIGGGGMGEVWRAEHRLLAQPAAAKIIRPDMLGGRDRDVLTKRFEREAQITAHLTSPHTVRLYDFGVTSGGALYYVMELLDGMDLQAMVQRFGPLDPERAVDFLEQACHALAEAHGAGLIHRDIKPSNLIACKAGLDRDFLKVLDFGLVKPPRQEVNLTQSGMLMGSPGYVAPEMALGRPIDGRADLYSLGCVGYFLLAGREVFDIDSPMAALKDHAYKHPPRPSERGGRAVPPELEELVLACLAKDPAGRPDDAETLARRLHACLPQRWSQERARKWWAEMDPP